MNNDEWQTLKLESYDISVAFMERKDTIEDLFKSKKSFTKNFAAYT